MQFPLLDECVSSWTLETSILPALICHRCGRWYKMSRCTWTGYSWPETNTNCPHNI